VPPTAVGVGANEGNARMSLSLVDKHRVCQCEHPVSMHTSEYGCLFGRDSLKMCYCWWPGNASVKMKGRWVHGKF